MSQAVAVKKRVKKPSSGKLHFLRSDMPEVLHVETAAGRQPHGRGFRGALRRQKEKGQQYEFCQCPSDGGPYMSGDELRQIAYKLDQLNGVKKPRLGCFYIELVSKVNDTYSVTGFGRFTTKKQAEVFLKKKGWGMTGFSDRWALPAESPVGRVANAFAHVCSTSNLRLRSAWKLPGR